jgi:hypothetical protein
MSTKIATWSKWPSKWLKRLPKAALAGRKGGLLDFEIRSLSQTDQIGSDRSKQASEAVLHFEDFMERPLRSTSQRQTDERRGRLTGETGSGSGGDDRGGSAGTQR